MDLGPPIDVDDFLRDEDDRHCVKIKDSNSGYFFAPVAEDEEEGVLFEQCALGERCKCHEMRRCTSDEDGCVTPHSCTDNSGNKRCTRFKTCKPKDYDETAILSLTCPYTPDLRMLSSESLGLLAADIKEALVERCDLKACGYGLDAKADLSAIDRDSIEFEIQGSGVSFRTGQPVGAEN